MYNAGMTNNMGNNPQQWMIQNMVNQEGFNRSYPFTNNQMSDLSYYNSN